MKSKPFKMKNPILAKAVKDGSPMQLNYSSPAKHYTGDHKGAKKHPGHKLSDYAKKSVDLIKGGADLAKGGAKEMKLFVQDFLKAAKKGFK